MPSNRGTPVMPLADWVIKCNSLNRSTMPLRRDRAGYSASYETVEVVATKPCE